MENWDFNLMLVDLTWSMSKCGCWRQLAIRTVFRFLGFGLDKMCHSHIWCYSVGSVMYCFLIIYNCIVLCLTHNSSEGEVRAHLELCTSPLRVVHSDTNIYSHTHSHLHWVYFYCSIQSAWFWTCQIKVHWWKPMQTLE